MERPALDRRERALRLAPALLVGLALLAAGCGSGGGGGGTLGFVHEREPNDFPDEADGIGFVDSNDFYAIRGHVDDFDTLDGFAFAADFPVDVEVVLHRDNPFADLVVYVYDPVTDTFPFVFDQPFDPLVGSFRVNLGPSDFHLVVGSLFGPSGYTLEVRGFPWGSYAGGAAPLAVAPGGRLTGPASTADDARRAAVEERGRPYRGAPGEDDEPGDAPRVLARGVLALVDDRGEVAVFDALATDRGTALAARD